jgi:hypothetical protein
VGEWGVLGELYQVFRITPVSVVRQVAEKYREVVIYKEFAGHAHWVVGEPGWEEIAEYVIEWLDRLE